MERLEHPSPLEPGFTLGEIRLWIRGYECSDIREGFGWGMRFSLAEAGSIAFTLCVSFARERLFAPTLLSRAARERACG